MNDGCHTDRIVALAGVFQAAALVQQIASRGSADPDAFAGSIGSLLRIDAESAEAVYGGPRGVHLGLRTLCDQFDRVRGRRDAEITRYAVSLMLLERRLGVRPDLLQLIRDGIEAAAVLYEDSAADDEDAIARFADLYLRTASTLPPRILVTGQSTLLRDTARVNRVRASLLAGVRAAVLWRQSGGNRWSLLFGRGRLLDGARRLLAAL